MTQKEQVAIVFTGRQGAGKTVLSRSIKNALQAAGVVVKTGPSGGYQDTLVVETTHDQRCYLSTDSQLAVGGVRITGLTPDMDKTLGAIHSVVAQYEDQGEGLRSPIELETALQAIAALTQKFLPEQDVRTQEALVRAAQDFTKASGKTVVVLLDEEAEKWTASKTKPARVDPKDNPNRRTYVSGDSGRFYAMEVSGHEITTFAAKGALERGLHFLCGVTHAASKNAGWYTNPTTGEPLDRNVPEMMMLTVSEIAEAMEGYRKGLMDDHLTDRLSVEVELADAVIRIGDLCGYLGLDLAGAVIEKMAYNAKREDHKLENRAKGGKAF